MKPLVSFGGKEQAGRFSRLPLDSFYWRYEEGGRCVDIGCFRSGGAWHFSTAEIVDKGYEPLDAEGIALVLGELMLERVSGWFGGGRIVLANDDRRLSSRGRSRRSPGCSPRSALSSPNATPAMRFSGPGRPADARFAGCGAGS